MEIQLPSGIRQTPAVSSLTRFSTQYVNTANIWLSRDTSEIKKGYNTLQVRLLSLGPRRCLVLYQVVDTAIWLRTTVVGAFQQTKCLLFWLLCMSDGISQFPATTEGLDILAIFPSSSHLVAGLHCIAAICQQASIAETWREMGHRMSVVSVTHAASVKAR